jgi:hypothetical protein
MPRVVIIVMFVKTLSFFTDISQRKLCKNPGEGRSMKEGLNLFNIVIFFFFSSSSGARSVSNVGDHLQYSLYLPRFEKVLMSFF